VLVSTPSVCSPCLPRLPEHETSHDRRNQPEQHVSQQHPDSVLHPGDALVALWVLANEHFAEDAKGHKITQKDERVDAEEKPGLEQYESQGADGAKCTANNGPYPFRVDVFPLLARVV